MRQLISWLTSFVKPLVEKHLESQGSAGASIKLSNEDKALFAKFCQFIWTQGEPIRLIFDVKGEFIPVKALPCHRLNICKHWVC